METKKISYPLRMTEELDGKLDHAAKRTGLSKQDIARLCLEIGLVDLKKCGYNLAEIISAQAYAPARQHTQHTSDLRLNEDPPPTKLAR